METPCSAAIAERPRLKKGLCIGPGGKYGEDGNRPARKRRCGVDRVDGYDTGCSIDDADTPFSEGTQLLKTLDLREVTCI